MLPIVLGIVAVVCAIGWLVNRINSMILIWYLQEKNVPMPTNEELKRGSTYVASHILKDVFASKRK